MGFNFTQTKKLKYPLKSHRKPIIIPKQSGDLAEFMGIVFGDGGINNDWQLIITLNSLADKEYSLYVEDLIKRLFKVRVYKRKRANENTLALICSSTTLVDFMVDKGAVRGNKIKQNINIPNWILKNRTRRKRFVRGVVDTDGGLFIHRHLCYNKPYCNIGLCFTSYSLRLIESVKEILDELGIKSYITDRKRRIYIYSADSIKQYLELVGSMNPRINGKYRDWLNKHSDWKGARAV
ncbi:MAG: LAGLIDADG family homing endonuclease [Candidatus Pacebacteria bacterium]|nr:LAGLIDADG family homing endonuclease [Candidatus Paceibacterota bacterium]